MGLFGKKEKATFYKFLVVDGCVPGMKAPSTVKISLFSDKIEIQQIVNGKGVAYLSYDQVTAAEKVNEKQIKEVDKSVIGRAMVGGVLLGPLGAVIGGVSGVGKKHKSTYKNFFVINYTSVSGDPSVLSFEMVGPPAGFASFLLELKQKAGISDAPAAGPTIL
ncbi:MAG: hypothetical protein U0M23_04165 [Acutalibacteraceae bacterium]|nr:hypothetical protein [Acutalibacteraceae bacterium]